MCIVLVGVSRIDWQALASIVRTKTSDLIDIELGSDRYIPYADYVLAHGDPLTNGRNHQQVNFNNEDCVHMPGPKEYVVKRRRQHEVSKTTTQATSSSAISLAHLDMNFQDLSVSMFAAFPRAVRCHTFVVDGVIILCYGDPLGPPSLIQQSAVHIDCCVCPGCTGVCQRPPPVRFMSTLTVASRTSNSRAPYLGLGPLFV